MLTQKTTALAADIADGLCEVNYRILPSETLPLADIVERLTTAYESEVSDFDPEVRDQIADAVSQASKTGHAEEVFDTFVENVTKGISATLENLHVNVVPAVRDVISLYENIFEDVSKPKINIHNFKLHPIHNQSSIVEHLHGDYDQYRPLESYRSFILEEVSTKTLCEWVCQNPHVSEDVVMEWISTLEDIVPQDSFLGIFNQRKLNESDVARILHTSDLNEADYLLFQYFLTGYLCNNPQDVIDESVTMDEWKNVLQSLHCLTGHALHRAYQKRAKYIKQKRLVLSTDSAPLSLGEKSYIKSLTTNGDIYGQWLNQGGNVQALIGAIITNDQNIYADDIDAQSEYFEKQFTRWYNLRLKEAELIDEKSRRRMIEMIFEQGFEDDENTSPLERLKGRYSKLELKRILRAELSAFSYADYKDIHRLLTKLVCRVFYPKTGYESFLEEMDRLGKNHPDMSAREIATLTACDVCVKWLCQMIHTQSVVYKEDDNSDEVPETTVIDRPQMAEEPNEDETPEETRSEDPEVQEELEAEMSDEPQEDDQEPLTEDETADELVDDESSANDESTVAA